MLIERKHDVKLIGNLIYRQFTRGNPQINGLGDCWRSTGMSLQAKYVLILQLAHRFFVPTRVGDD